MPNRPHESHLEVLTALDFVHERLPSSLSRGDSFVPKANYSLDFPTIRVRCDADSTELDVFDGVRSHSGFAHRYNVRFDPSTPASVLMISVMTAIGEVADWPAIVVYDGRDES